MSAKDMLDGLVGLWVVICVMVTAASGAYASFRWATGPACCSTACPCTEAAKCSR